MEEIIHEYGGMILGVAVAGVILAGVTGQLSPGGTVYGFFSSLVQGCLGGAG